MGAFVKSHGVGLRISTRVTTDRMSPGLSIELQPGSLQDTRTAATSTPASLQRVERSNILLMILVVNRLRP